VFDCSGDVAGTRFSDRDFSGLLPEIPVEQMGQFMENCSIKLQTV
jgi:hypothetical protein